jgi:hypothetical protein
MTPANPKTIAERVSTADDTPIADAASHNAAAVPTATSRKRIPVMVHLAPCCAAVYGRFDRAPAIARVAPFCAPDAEFGILVAARQEASDTVRAYGDDVGAFGRFTGKPLRHVDAHGRT